MLTLIGSHLNSGSVLQSDHLIGVDGRGSVDVVQLVALLLLLVERLVDHPSHRLDGFFMYVLIGWLVEEHICVVFLDLVQLLLR